MDDSNGEVTEPLSAEELVAHLQSDDTEERQKALDQLYPDGGGAMLFEVGPELVRTAWTGRVDAGRMFVGLLQMSQVLGRNLGMDLQWLKAPDDPNRIVVPSGFG